MPVAAQRNDAPSPADAAPMVSSLDVADGKEAARSTYDQTTIEPTVILDGYGVAVRVNCGALVCQDGIADLRRQRRITRAQAAAGRVRRVLVLGDGIVTTEAAAWCHSMGVALVIANTNGECFSTGTPALFDHGGLRRAQALAPFTPVGMSIVRWLLDNRLADQARIVRDLAQQPENATAIETLRNTLPDVSSVPDAMIVEMHAAERYWTAWADSFRMRYAPRDRARIPAHWKAMDGRVSPLNDKTLNRHAASPVNALLNLGMRLGEIEALLAAQAIGLDPGMGLAHADRQGRSSLALDLLETGRGLVEETVWQLSLARPFRKRDFAELGSGEIRVLAPLSHEFAASLLPALRDRFAPYAERLATMLATVSTSDVRIPTALTRSRQKAAYLRRTSGAGEPESAAKAVAIPWACPDCGGQVTGHRRVRCDQCMAKDPRQTVELRGRRGAAIASRRLLQAEWTAGGGVGDFDPNDWLRIQQALASVKLSEIMRVTGLSKGFSSAIRAGKSRPHPSLWPALAMLAAESRANSA